MAATGGTSTLSLYANNPEWGGAPIIGTLSLKYSADFTSAEVLSVHCSPQSWCALWPDKLINGKAAAADFDHQSNCLWEDGEKRGSAQALVSKWTSDTGTTWMCPVPGGGNQVNGSWLYNNNEGSCMPQTGKPYPCPSNKGPYYNGIQVTLPDGGGIVVTQWEGWNFVPPTGVANGRSIFGLPTATGVHGMFCVYNQSSKTISYCFPEPYTLDGMPTQAECNQYDVFPPEFAGGLAARRLRLGGCAYADRDLSPRSKRSF